MKIYMEVMREKLIELLNQGADKTPCHEECWDKKCNDCIRESQADHLIANGVTLQKWIPVSERLPEENKKVLGTKKGASAAFVFYGKWHNGNWYDLEWSCYRYGVTHWMPLPQPHKGE